MHVENHVYFASLVRAYAVLTVVFKVKHLYLTVTRCLWRLFQTFCNYMLQTPAAGKAISSKIERTCYILKNMTAMTTECEAL